MANFLFLINYAGRLLRPIGILARIGNQGLTVIVVILALIVLPYVLWRHRGGQVVGTREP